MLSHINSSLVRLEYKLIYTSYALPSLRFHLTVHHLTKTQLSSLDALSTRFLKSWLSLPPCATTSVLYDPLSLNLHTISSLYSECHALSQAKLALPPDPLVRSALEYKIKQSSSYTKKTVNCPPDKQTRFSYSRILLSLISFATIFLRKATNPIHSK